MSSMRRQGVAVVGAGGHAKVVIATIQAAGFSIAALVDDDPTKKGLVLLGVEVAGKPDQVIPTLRNPVVAAIGDNASRRRLVLRFPDLKWLPVVHPAAVVHPSVRLGPGSVVFAGAVIQPDTVIGTHAIVNTGATIDHDCEIGDFAHIGPGCHLSGGVAVGEGALLGVGGCVRPGARVGSWATIGAGAAVVGVVPDRSTFAGVPARPFSKRPR